MFNFFNLGKLFQITSRSTRYVFVLFMIVLAIGLSESLFLSPEDYKQSHSVRIMYVHVPAAWISLGIFSVITFLSIIGYIFRIRNFFLISKNTSRYINNTNIGHASSLSDHSSIYMTIIPSILVRGRGFT